MLRKTCPRHFVTTNNVGLVDTINHARPLRRSWISPPSDNYPGFFDMLMAQQGRDGSSASRFVVIALGHDFARSVKGGKPFMIMEEQSGKAGQKTFSPQPENGQAAAVDLSGHRARRHGS